MCAAFFTGGTPGPHAQELSAPGSALEKGEQALVDGDNVRVRSGPTLAHRILGMVNSGDRALILEKGSFEAIGDMKSHWYQVKVEKAGLEGWVYGWFLKRPDYNTSSVLQAGERALVTADEVRLRTGPSLEYRIIGSVDTGAGVSILERSTGLQTVGQVSSHWYRVKVDKGKEGWIFGSFLKKRGAALAADTGSKSPDPEIPAGPAAGESSGSDESSQAPEPRFLDNQVLFAESGTIDQPDSATASGDLDGNGSREILFLSHDERGRMSLTAFEPRGERFDRVWSTPLSGRDAESISVLETGTGEQLLTVQNDTFSTLYLYDDRRQGLVPVRRVDSPFLALGLLDGRNDYLVHLERTRAGDNDGTVTYTLRASMIEMVRGRMRVLETFSYPYSLPVKKMLAFDLDSDGSDEIVCEIGGTDKGGGLVILGLADGTIHRIENTGILTYEDRPFQGMWGVTRGEQPFLVLYTSDPADSGNMTADVGFVSAVLESGGLRLHRFEPVGSLLDDADTERKVVLYPDSGGQLPFMLLDYRDGRYLVMQPLS
jgi:uncharacterized protein YgiM (DUF1202 family)